MNLLEPHEPHCQLPDGHCCRRGKWRDIEEPATIAIVAVVGGFIRDAVTDKPSGEKLDLGVKLALVGRLRCQETIVHPTHGYWMQCECEAGHSTDHRFGDLVRWPSGSFVGPDGSFTV